jgi:DNA repair protein RadA/Sms
MSTLSSSLREDVMSKNAEENRILYLVKNDRPTLANLDSEDEEDAVGFYTTGNVRVDTALGGGIAKGAMYMLSGEPGAGKSTWAMCAIDWLRRYNGITCLYATAEEDSRMLRRRRRLLNSTPNVYIQGDFEVMFSDVLDVEELCERIRTSGAQVVVIDSIQKLSYGKKRGQKAALAAIEKLYAMARHDGITFLCICQSNKSGDFSGLQGLKHEVDCHIHFINEERAMVGTSHVLKNRFGPPGVTF